MEWLSDTSANSASEATGNGCSGAGESIVTEGSVDKRPSQIGLFAGLTVLAAIVGLLFFGDFGASTSDGAGAEADLDSRSAEDQPDASQQAGDQNGPVSTAMTLVNGGDTLNGEAEVAAQAALKSSSNEPNMPDRGAFREAFVANLVASCDYLVDGPEPVADGLYREHGRCLAEALENLDERCRLAAAFFYVLPGDEAVAVACDTGEEAHQFRDTVRQSMVVQCDVARESRVSQSHEAYYEYDRCLQLIEPQLDETCYLVARAQFHVQVEQVIREACNIGEEVDLSTVLG